MLHQQRYVELFTANGFNETVECRQAVYTNKEKLSVSGLYRPDGRPMPNGLIIRKLDADDIQEAAPMYPGFDNPDYIIERIEAGAVYGAFLVIILLMIPLIFSRELSESMRRAASACSM